MAASVKINSVTFSNFITNTEKNKQLTFLFNITYTTGNLPPFNIPGTQGFNGFSIDSSVPINNAQFPGIGQQFPALAVGEGNLNNILPVFNAATTNTYNAKITLQDISVVQPTTVNQLLTNLGLFANTGNFTFRLSDSAGESYTLTNIASAAASIQNAIAANSTFINAANICFLKGTRILTPTGYKAVELLEVGHRISSSKDLTSSIPIKAIINFIGKKENEPLYCLPKDSLKKNSPINDLYMSGEHAYKYNGIWRHMKCASKTEFLNSKYKKYTIPTDQDNIEYYHIVIEDYFANTIVAEGVEVESCFKEKDDGIYMLWNCDEKGCTPLKSEKKYIKKEKTPRNIYSTMHHIMNIENTHEEKVEKNIINIVKGEKKKKTAIMWRYDKELNKNVPVQFNEITLPLL